MAAPRNLPHIVLSAQPRAEPFKSHQTFQPDPIVTDDRPGRGAAFIQTLNLALDEADERREEAATITTFKASGVFVTFESRPGIPLDLIGLQAKKAGIEVVSWTQSRTEATAPVEYATVFIPDGKASHFIDKFKTYANSTPKKFRETRHEGAFDPVAALSLATLRAFWTDRPEDYPESDEAIWWEVWLRKSDGKSLERLTQFADEMGLTIAPRQMVFDDRAIALVQASSEQLALAVDVLDDLAELRKAHAVETHFVDMPNRDQKEWVEDLVKRVTAPKDNAPAVCLLDTGVNRGHPLLSPVLSATDCHTCEPTWGTHDHEKHGHGTHMAGLAAYGDLTPALLSTQAVTLSHHLESVKILTPPRQKNQPDIYGVLTAQAAKLAEDEAPERRRCFSLTVTAGECRNPGQPTLWSASVDALAVGRGVDKGPKGIVILRQSGRLNRRLFVIAAGNHEFDPTAVAAVDRSDLEPIEDPAQAWNALTVGACTDKVVIKAAEFVDYTAISPAGELSPYSRTGVLFGKTWPNKPDVVFEGGNGAVDSKGFVNEGCPELNLLSTGHEPAKSFLAVTAMTSAATAQVAGLAAQVWADQPDLWPETIRALVVHSARWTPHMEGAFKESGSQKTKRIMLVRRYGFGVPDAVRAKRSATDALTLVIQNRIQPLQYAKSAAKIGNVHFIDLPWPKDELEQLGEQEVTLRVTLSYFIEPNPARRGWKGRYRYASHGLRFDVRGATESTDEFRKRLNKNALAEDEAKPSGGSDPEWFVGSDNRHRGSLHHDTLTVTAVNLASRGMLAVYPVGGWWKDLTKTARRDTDVRYSLLVSIEAPGVDVDLYTAVKTQVSASVSVNAPKSPASGL